MVYIIYNSTVTFVIPDSTVIIGSIFDRFFAQYKIFGWFLFFPFMNAAKS